jgi:hypothetical protein
LHVDIYICLFDFSKQNVMTKQTILFLIPFLMLLSLRINAQEVPVEDHTYKPLTLKLNENGSKYVRFIMWHQFWATATQNNPGTRDVNGNVIDGTNGSSAWSSDIALRRSRFLAYAQVSPRVMILTHWGINNQSFINGATAPNGPNPTTTPSNQGKKPQLFLHDAWTEFRIIPQKLYIGVGLHYWNGVSRLSSHSTLNFMTLDAPIFNWHNIEATDQFARQFGIYAKGQLGKLDYRIALNKPFVNGASPSAVPKIAEARNVLMKIMPQQDILTGCFGTKNPTFFRFLPDLIWEAKRYLTLVWVGIINPMVRCTKRPQTQVIKPNSFRCRCISGYAFKQRKRNSPVCVGTLYTCWIMVPIISEISVFSTNIPRRLH